jgi:hypothetical protein
VDLEKLVLSYQTEFASMFENKFKNLGQQFGMDASTVDLIDLVIQQKMTELDMENIKGPSTDSKNRIQRTSPSVEPLEITGGGASSDSDVVVVPPEDKFPEFLATLNDDLFVDLPPSCTEYYSMFAKNWALNDEQRR